MNAYLPPLFLEDGALFLQKNEVAGGVENITCAKTYNVGVSFAKGGK
jgi:hypothetical protein